MKQRIWMLLAALAAAGCAPDPQVSQAEADRIRMQTMVDAALQLQQAQRVPPTTESLPWMILAFVICTSVVCGLIVFLFFALRIKPEASGTQIVRVVERQMVILTQSPRGQWIIRDNDGSHVMTAGEMPALLEDLFQKQEVRR